MKQKLTKYLIALAMALAPTLASSQSWTDGNGTTWSYTLDASNKATITGASPALSGHVNIPGTVGGYTVISILNPYNNSASNGIAKNAAITSISLPSSLTSIGTYAFQLCTSITEVIIPAGVTTIGGLAFNGCYALTTLNWDGATALKTIGGNAFDNCHALLGDLTIPAGVTSIGSAAFYKCPKLRSVKFIGKTLSMSSFSRVFYLCSGLEYIDMTSITSIPTSSSFDRTAPNSPGNYFAGLPAHTVVYLPNSTPTSLLTSLSSTSNVNYVLNGKCDWFYVQDGCDYYLPYGFTATKATWNAATATGTVNGSETTPNDGRTFTAGSYVTANLPFPFTVPTGVKAYTLTGITTNTPDEGRNPYGTATFGAASTTCAANYPYVLSAEANATGVLFVSPITIDKTPAPKLSYDVAGNVTSSIDLGTFVKESSTITDNHGVTWAVYGTTEHIDHASALALGAYGVSNSKWQPVLPENTGYLSALRAFLAPVNGPTSAKPISFDIVLDDDGSTNGIGNVENDNLVETRIYNIGGQYMGKDINALPKGLYIVNGKKVMK